MDSKTVIVQLESLDRGAKREILLWTTPNICEMKAVDWFLEKSVIFAIWRYQSQLGVEKLTYSLEVAITRNCFYHSHRIGKLGEPVGVKTPLG